MLRRKKTGSSLASSRMRSVFHFVTMTESVGKWDLGYFYHVKLRKGHQRRSRFPLCAICNTYRKAYYFSVGRIHAERTIKCHHFKTPGMKDILKLTGKIISIPCRLSHAAAGLK